MSRTVVEHEYNLLEGLEEVDVVIAELLDLVDELDLQLVRDDQAFEQTAVLLEGERVTVNQLYQYHTIRITINVEEQLPPYRVTRVTRSHLELLVEVIWDALLAGPLAAVSDR